MLLKSTFDLLERRVQEFDRLNCLSADSVEDKTAFLLLAQMPSYLRNRIILEVLSMEVAMNENSGVNQRLIDHFLNEFRESHTNIFV